MVSFAGAAAITGGEVRIRNAAVGHLEMISQAFRRLGVAWQVDGDDLLVGPQQTLTIVPDLDGAIPEIKTNVWPAYPTDLISIAITVATQAAGSVLFHDWMYSGRMYFTDKLVSMGAQDHPLRSVSLPGAGPHTAVQRETGEPGYPGGHGAGAGRLGGPGHRSTIRNISQIDRGYENVEGKLKALGAQIERIAE